LDPVGFTWASSVGEMTIVELTVISREAVVDPCAFVAVNVAVKVPELV
jgi:hypothetical protein